MTTEEKQQEEKKTASQPKSSEKKISLQEFLSEKNLKPKSLADYAVIYLRKKMGALAAKSDYEAALNGLLTKKV